MYFRAPASYYINMNINEHTASIKSTVRRQGVLVTSDKEDVLAAQVAYLTIHVTPLSGSDDVYAITF